MVWKPKLTPSTERMRIGPALASEMLTHNTQNRPQRTAKITRLAEKMKTSAWTFTHQGIGFSTEGKLIDGQHRLMAIIKSGVSHEFLVTFGLPPEAFANLDTEGSRTSEDLFAIRNPEAKNRKQLCAMSRSMMRGIAAPTNDAGPAVVSEFAEWYYPMLIELFQALRQAPQFARKAPVLAAFGNAVRGIDEWPGGHGQRDKDTILLIAMRYAGQEWEGNEDPMKVLFKRFCRAHDTVGGNLTELEQYSLTVAAIRACLRGQKNARAQQTEIEWGAENDRGQKPRQEIVTGPSRTATRRKKESVS